MTSNQMIRTLILVALATMALTGCSSDDNNPVAAAPIVPPVVDTAPPAAPTGVAAIHDMDAVGIAVSWDANVTDSDLAGYVVSRTADGVTTDLTPWVTPITSYLDDEAPAGQNVYAVCAIDASGNRSAGATVKINVQPIQ